MQALVATANQSGFSRKAKDLDLEAGQTFIVIPVLREYSPVKSWICLVVAFPHSLKIKAGEKPECSFGRLDVSEGDLKSLSQAKAKVRDQLVHWMSWEAYRGWLQNEK